MEEEEGQHDPHRDDGEVDPPNPPPVDELAKRRPDDGSADAASRHGQGVQAEVQRALFQAGKVGEDDLAQDVQTAAAQALQDAARDQDGHTVGDAEDEGPAEEEEECGVQRHLAA